MCTVGSLYVSKFSLNTLNTLETVSDRNIDLLLLSFNDSLHRLVSDAIFFTSLVSNSKIVWNDDLMIGLVVQFFV